jgi:hypothetical protein
MNGIKLISEIGPNHYLLELKKRNVIEDDYFKDYNADQYPKKHSRDDITAHRIIRELETLVKRITPPKSMEEIGSLADQCPEEFQTDYLFQGTYSDLEKDTYQIIPLFGVRLSFRYSQDNITAITNSLRDLCLPGAKHLYFLQKDFFVEADRVLLAKEPFSLEVKYNSDVMQKMSDSIKELCSQ